MEVDKKQERLLKELQDSNEIFKLFDDYLQAELYNSRSHDVGEPTTRIHSTRWKCYGIQRGFH